MEKSKDDVHGELGVLAVCCSLKEDDQMSTWKIPPDGGHLDKASGIYLQNMTWKQIEERLKANDIIIVPVGSTEAHGPHAPLGEDTFLVTRMAEAVAQRTGR